MTHDSRRLPRRSWIALVCLTILVATQAPAQQSTESVSDLIALGTKHFGESRLDSALTYYFAGLRVARATGDRPWEATALNNIGLVYGNAGRPDSALFFHRLSLSIKRSGNDREGEEGSLNNIGAVFSRIGEVDSALSYYRAALALQLAGFGREDEVLTLGNIGSAYDKIGQADSALRYYHTALPLARGASDRTGEVRMLKKIGDVYGKIGPVDSAMWYHRAVLQIRRADGDRAGEANALNNIGVIYDNVARSDSALAYYRAALLMYREVGDHHGEATALGNIGLALANVGHPDSALVSYNAALSLFRAQGDHAATATTLSNIGALFMDIGQPDSALLYHRAALPLQRGAHDRDGEATVLGNIGSAYDKIGQLDSALVYHRIALTIRREIGDKAGEAGSLGSIGLVHGKLGRPDSALYYSRAALPLYRAIDDRRGEATTLSDIAVEYYNIDQPDSALFYYRAALPLQRASNDRGGLANTLTNIGVLYIEIGHPDSALAFFRLALPLREAVRDRPGFATTLTHIGESHRLLSRGDSALIYFQRALPINREVGDREGEAITLTSIAELYATVLAKDRLYKAAQYLDSAAAITASLRTRSGGDANAIAFAEKERGVFNAWTNVWVGLAGLETGPARERAIYSALAAAERGRAQGLRDLLDVKTGATSLAKRRPATGLSGVNERPADTLPGSDLVAEATHALAPLRAVHSAALYFYVAGNFVVAWLVEPTGELKIVPTGKIPPDSLAELITTIRGGVGADKARRSMTSGVRYSSEQEPRAKQTRGVGDEDMPSALVERAASVLSTQVLPSDLLSEVPAGSEIVIVPHGLLGLVPFAALTAPGDSIPLGIRYSIRYTPSLRALDAVERKQVAAGVALVVGDPAMPSVMDSNGRTVALRQLPAAKEEAAKVAQKVGAPLLSGAAATETIVRAQLPRARIVHLATHGLAYGTEALVRNSYVALAADSQNDGLLTIGELLDNVPSLSADLVVLSACQTGLGDLKQAEGTVGFQRAFLSKGARSVLVSLWSVDDKATAILMDRFYTHWLGPDRQPSMSKAEALRQAQSDVRSTKGYESPKYWAAFQLVGAR